MSEPTIGGAAEFRRLARRLDRITFTGPAQTAITTATLPLKAAARASAAARLPRRGGLAARVAGTTITTRARRGLATAGVRMVAEPGPVRDPASIDRGRLLRPTFGHRPMVIQLVRPGWFTEPVRRGAPAVRARIEQAISAEIRKQG